MSDAAFVDHKTNPASIPPTLPAQLRSEERLSPHEVPPNVQDELRPRLARSVLLGARIVTAVVVGSGALFGGLFSSILLFSG
jgi:hypothetical protein